MATLWHNWIHYHFPVPIISLFKKVPFLLKSVRYTKPSLPFLISKCTFEIINKFSLGLFFLVIDTLQVSSRPKVNVLTRSIIDLKQTVNFYIFFVHLNTNLPIFCKNIWQVTSLPQGSLHVSDGVHKAVSSLSFGVRVGGKTSSSSDIILSVDTFKENLHNWDVKSRAV